MVPLKGPDGCGELSVAFYLQPEAAGGLLAQGHMGGLSVFGGLQAFLIQPATCHAFAQVEKVRVAGERGQAFVR